MATHSSVLAWRIPGLGEPGGLPSMGSHRVAHDWSDLAAAACSCGSNKMVYLPQVGLWSGDNLRWIEPIVKRSVPLAQGEFPLFSGGAGVVLSALGFACRTRSFVRALFVCSGAMAQKCSETLIFPISSLFLFPWRTRLNPENGITSEVNITSEYFQMEKPMRGSYILESRKEQEAVLPRALSRHCSGFPPLLTGRWLRLISTRMDSVTWWWAPLATATQATFTWAVCTSSMAMTWACPPSTWTWTRRPTASWRASRWGRTSRFPFQSW